MHGRHGTSSSHKRSVSTIEAKATVSVEQYRSACPEACQVHPSTEKSASFCRHCCWGTRSDPNYRQRWYNCSYAATGLSPCVLKPYVPSTSFACPFLAGPKHDLVLSSGFLAFAAHSGFLKAVEEVGLAGPDVRDAQRSRKCSCLIVCRPKSQ